MVLTKEQIQKTISEYFAGKPVKKAWLFGSYARGEATPGSDIDVMVRFNDEKKISVFDLADITFRLEQQTNRKVDLVEKDCLLPFAYETAKNDLIKIYG